MDNFLRDFREKVNRAKKPEVQASDWEQFKAYKSGETINEKPVISKRFPKRIITGAAASLLLGISLFAYFAFPGKSDENNMAIEGKTNSFSDSQTGQNGTEAQLSEDLPIETEVINKKMQSAKINSKGGDTKSLAESVFEPSKMVDNRTTKNNEFSTTTYQPAKKRDFSNNDFVQKINYPEKQKEFSAFEDPVDSKKLFKNEDNNLVLDIQSAVNEPTKFLGLKKIESVQKKSILVQAFRESVELNESFAIVSIESETPAKHRFQLGGAVHFIIPVEDRIGAVFHTGKRIFGSYQITDRLSIGINWSQSAYSRTIPDKKMYPSLDEINPRSTEDQLEELTVDASFNKAGLYLTYDILRAGKLINKIGLGLQRDISAKFDFKMHVRDPMGAPNIQHQNKNIIPKSRYFISPQYQMSYAVVDHVNVFANTQYDISLSPFREKYLSVDVGAAYVF